MRVVFFCHSVLSDWNNGNAHFTRGLAMELERGGHRVVVYEPLDAWSAQNLVRDHGPVALESARRAYPSLDVVRYDARRLDLDAALEDASLVVVHEWNDPALVAAVGRYRARRGGMVLLFHDTHHRSVTQPEAMGSYDLSAYDGVLAFGEALREVYESRGWARRAWTLHEAADTRIFRPLAVEGARSDLVWIGNWGDDERTAELREFLIEPVRNLGLEAIVHGVRYSDAARAELAAASIRYAGYAPNHCVPELFARHRITVHVPRRPYASRLPGIPTIRVFEALACGIPLVSAPWDDSEGLFSEGRDYLRVTNGAEMQQSLRALLHDEELACALAEHGLRTVLARHTCAHRARELLAIVRSLGGSADESRPAHPPAGAAGITDGGAP